ncbi:hypothetical protein GBAR_LOCUS19774 [Geodia barretti]|uniref:Uncharacterized protein n=1 Tax=Geodia barretti TaxID=519541 RepID=A0AA35SUZ3_GEOBA|nr:hypothetical protein GBAR_LOCUS19774 [Geodia barretti]
MELAIQAWEFFMSERLYPFRVAATGVGVLHLARDRSSRRILPLPIHQGLRSRSSRNISAKHDKIRTMGCCDWCF